MYYKFYAEQREERLCAEFHYWVPNENGLKVKYFSTY